MGISGVDWRMKGTNYRWSGRMGSKWNGGSEKNCGDCRNGVGMDVWEQMVWRGVEISVVAGGVKWKIEGKWNGERGRRSKTLWEWKSDGMRQQQIRVGSNVIIVIVVFLSFVVFFVAVFSHGVK